ncbi:hypothetical protein SDC9_143843 [bioreactor metagenome]|uniref:Uncharacterized protein n=1 Tax=bioreactor metagenome TaxID=1076179 RepID=A0A645E5M1_9ZZZZ
MFRSDLQLAADMISAKLVKKFRFFILKYVVIPEPRADENFFYPRYLPQFPEKADIPGMIRFKLFTRAGVKA